MAKPQTKEGMARLIGVILNLHGQGGCNASECKEAINSLIRAYGAFFCHPKPNAVSFSALQKRFGEVLCRDHVVPVRVIMLALMQRAVAYGHVENEFIIQYLDEHLLTCEITQSEDEKLRRAKLWRDMPQDASDPETGRILNLWARYEHPEVLIDRSLSHHFE